MRCRMMKFKSLTQSHKANRKKKIKVINQFQLQVQKVQDVDMTKEERRVKVTLLVHDEDGENPQVEIDLQSP